MTLNILGVNNLDDVEMNIEGAKNAILPLLVAKVFVPGKTTFKNVPSNSEDFQTMIKILNCLGLTSERNGDDLTVNNEGIKSKQIPVKLAEKTRYSGLFIGALGADDMNLFPYPGGCSLEQKEQWIFIMIVCVI